MRNAELTLPVLSNLLCTFIIGGIVQKGIHGIVNLFHKNLEVVPLLFLPDQLTKRGGGLTVDPSHYLLYGLVSQAVEKQYVQYHHGGNEGGSHKINNRSDCKKMS